jgi:glycosyltransferase involved in cell wall biosynthesis
MSERTPKSPPVILPLPTNANSPVLSVMIPTYNCIAYIKQTLDSVLLQDWGVEQMQIEVVDDGSTDGDVEALVQQIGGGRVGFFKQEKNVGSLRNFETCINRAKGKWVHILHGDDCVKPGFYEEIKRLFTTFPEIGAAVTSCIEMDEKGKEKFRYDHVQENFGIVEDWLYRIAKRQLVNPPAIVIKRSVYEKLGSFYAVHYGEDWEMWARIGTQFKVAYSPTPLALYRVHGNNITSNSFATGQNIKDINTVINIVQQYLPADKRGPIKKEAKRFFSILFTKTAHKILRKQKNRKVAIRQAFGALQMQANPTTFMSAVKILGKSIFMQR